MPGDLTIMRYLTVLLVYACLAWADDARARNVVLFLADAGGLATLNAASIHAHQAPAKLYVHGMPHIALCETSSASRWVTDSAAGMTAIVTGHKTHNGVISQSSAAVRGKRDGDALKTILEHAEERGLATGVISNSSVLSATPAATYAHVNDRKNELEIFRQLLKGRFGDGIDVVIGNGRKDVLQAAAGAGLEARTALEQAGLGFFDSLEAIPGDARRLVAVFDGNFDLDAATQRAIDILSRNPNGFFLMVESDVHTEEVLRGFQNVIQIDNAVRRTAGRLNSDTLILFTADHSYDFRVHDGSKGEPLIPASTADDFGDDVDSIRLENIRRDDDHTGEEVLVSAQGPGAERVRGVLSNTDLFHIMMAAYGWK
jgi:alkaline phosphatase